MATLTTSRGRTYEFAFVRQSDNSVRAYIVRQPSYGSRDSGAAATHRLTDEADGNRQYICWKGTLSTEKEAMTVAKGWAVRTDAYIDTGVWKR